MTDRDSVHERLIEWIADLRGVPEDVDPEQLLDDQLGKNLEALARIAGFDPAEEGGDAELGRVGPYELTACIGEGGVGKVYRAVQRAPLKRTVAVKVIKAGMDSARVLHRFEVERQTLALMDHPNIARALDAGTTAEGRPYFVMELVHGVPITQWCEQSEAPVEERLRLSLEAIDAVQYAHLRGVLHRDIKPSNVLVDDTGGRPTVKIIDFGIAKATEPELAGETLLTEAGQILGTPEYMSPEQAAMAPGGVDARSDVYSLGVIVYVLLTGALPIPSLELRGGGIAEMPRRLRTREPKPPSTLVAGTLSRRLRGDLDWILLKALEKDPARRYVSAGDLASDIRRHLNHEAVSAGPPTAAYRLRKLVRRHRTAAVAVVATAVALILGLAATAHQAVRARQAEAVAERETEVAEAVNRFLVDMLSRADPQNRSAAREMTVGEMLDEAAATLDEGTDAPPEVEFAIRTTVGRAYSVLDRYDRAAFHLEQALAMADAAGEPGARIRALHELGVHRTRAGDEGAADSLAALEVDAARSAFGAASQEYGTAVLRQARARARLGAMAEADSLFGIGRRVLGDAGDDARGMEALRDYGRFLLDMERLDEAEAVCASIHETALERYGPEHPLTADALNLVADLRSRQGELEESLALRRRALEVIRRSYGEDSRPVLVARHNIGRVLINAGRPEEAKPLLEASLAAARRLHGSEHPMVATVQSTLAYALLRLDDVEGANRLYRDSLRIKRQARGSDHPSLFRNINDLASTLRRLDRNAEAESLFAEALVRGRELYGGDHPTLAVMGSNLGKSRADLGEFDAALAAHLEALAVAERTFPPGRAEVERIRANYGECLLRMGRYAESREILERAWDALQAKVDPGHAWCKENAGWLAECCRALGDTAAARTWEARAR
jgi:non-specific serine/threonine protein kinase/serine/threonine-protein kinase